MEVISPIFEKLILVAFSNNGSQGCMRNGSNRSIENSEVEINLGSQERVPWEVIKFLRAGEID